MEEIIINGKALYTPKGAAREYAAVGCNFYTGCPHNCSYCYLKRGAPSKQLGGTEVKLKKCFKNHDDAAMTLCKEIDKHLDYLRRVGLFLSFTTDPLIPQTRELSKFTILSCVQQRGIPVTLLTKNADFIDDGVFFSWMMTLLEEDRKKVAFGFTLTGRDDMEPMASTNQERIETMRRLKELGFRTWASIEPIIDFNSSLRVIKDSLKFCDHYKIGLRSGVSKSYYSDDELASFVSELSVIHVENDCTMYIKDSIRKRYYNQDVIDFISVPQKYNIFEHD